VFRSEDAEARCCIWSIHGSLSGNSSLASDRQGELVERDRRPPVHRLRERQLVVPSADMFWTKACPAITILALRSCLSRALDAAST
jgi:hypothetical protein